MVKDTKDRDEKYELIKTCFDLGGKPYIKICCPCCDNLTEGSYQVITDIPKKIILLSMWSRNYTANSIC